MRFAIIVLFLIGPGAAAQDFTSRSPDIRDYLGRLDTSEQALEEACAALLDRAPSNAQAWLRIGVNGLEIAPDPGRSAEAAAFWVDFALGAREAARTLYGDAQQMANGPVLIELGANGAAMFNGENRSEGDLCETMRGLVGAMSPAPTIR
ncbi:MAG: hypothetical protein AAF401_18815, partial [Pseudomonadota bacterium]